MSPEVTICKPIGGGVIDIQNVSAATADQKLQQGYYQCGDGHASQTGWCVNGEKGMQCDPPSAFVRQPTKSMSTAPANNVASMSTPVAANVRSLPDVGGGSDMAWALIAGFLIAVIVEGVRRAVNR